MARRKSVTQEEYTELLKEWVRTNEMRELSQSEERDPYDLLPEYYIKGMEEKYVVKRPYTRKPKAKPKKEVKPKVKKKEVKRGRRKTK